MQGLKFSTVAVTLISLCCLAACQMTTESKPAISIDDVFEASVPGSYFYTFNEPEGDDSRDTDFASFRFAASMLWHFHGDRGGMTMEEAVEAARADLATREGRDRALAEQALALMLLNKHLADGGINSTSPAELAQRQPAPEDQVVIGFAMELLIENANPNADLLSAGLATLDGYWPEERISDLATIAARQAESILQRGDDCPGCKPMPNTMARAEAIEAGIRSLDRIASR
jgi:hypothetical protein